MVRVHPVQLWRGQALYQLGESTLWPELTSLPEYVETVLEDADTEALLPGDEDYAGVERADRLTEGKGNGVIIGWRDKQLGYVRLECVFVVRPRVAVKAARRSA
jgi:hypothetical protein